MTPTQRAMIDLKRMGFLAEKVEQRLPKCFITRDLFNVIDILAVREGIGTLGVQVTSGSNHAARRTKSVNEPKLRTWLSVGNRFEIWSYAKRGERGKRKLWELRREEVRMEDLSLN